jgi:hypothetical protein
MIELCNILVTRQLIYLRALKMKSLMFQLLHLPHNEENLRLAGAASAGKIRREITFGCHHAVAGNPPPWSTAVNSQ